MKPCLPSRNFPASVPDVTINNFVDTLIYVPGTVPGALWEMTQFIPATIVIPTTYMR